MWILAKFTSGLVPGAAFRVANSIHGSVSVLGDGHTARFTPAAGYLGRAGFSFTGTDKDVESFPLRQVRVGTFASTGLPFSVIPADSLAAQSPGGEGTCGVPEGCWDISQLTDGPGAAVKGLEVAFQVPFNEFYRHLPPVIDGLGIVANYTFVDSTVAPLEPASELPGPPPAASTFRRACRRIAGGARFRERVRGQL